MTENDTPLRAPAPAPKQKSWFAKHKVLTVILALIVIGIISSVLSSGKKDNSSTPSTSNKTPAASNNNQAKATAKVGDAVRDGKFEFTVKSIKCGQATVGSNSYLTKTAQGQYCLVDMTVKNIGNEAQSLLSSNQYLYNAAGQKYSADDSATIYAAPTDSAGSTWYNDINPGNSVEGTIVFDIPKDQTPVKAELHDSAYSGGVTISVQ